jgi:putative transposase
VNAFIDEHRARCGVEPICSALQVAPSAYRLHAARRRLPGLRPERAKRDALLLPEVQRVFDQNLQVYGADKVWRQLLREGLEVARCTVERLMRVAGLPTICWNASSTAPAVTWRYRVKRSLRCGAASPR